MPCLQPVVGCWWCEFSLSSRQRQGANLIFMRALYRDRYVHTYMVCTFYTNLWLVLRMQKTTTKPCVCQVKCPPFFLVKRTTAQVPFFSLGKTSGSGRPIFVGVRQDAPTELRTFDPYDILGVRLDVYGGKGWLSSVPQCYACWMHGTRKGTKQNLRDHCLQKADMIWYLEHILKFTVKTTSLCREKLQSSLVSWSVSRCPR